MFGAKNNIHHFILLLSVSSFLIAPVSSIKCYQCDSSSDQVCADDPKQTKFEVECKKTPTDSTEYECARGSVDAELLGMWQRGTLMRGCMKKGKECHPDNAIIVPLGPTRRRRQTPPPLPSLKPTYKVHWCDTCDSDLCNSTALLSAEMWILTLSLIIQLQWQ